MVLHRQVGGAIYKSLTSLNTEAGTVDYIGTVFERKIRGSGRYKQALELPCKVTTKRRFRQG
jgi:hypothetical protein